ncbi:LysR substrate-binding domain-containing protein [Rhizobium tropici]|uniref:LysR substrate-binding domain-containing protein n=1 Tax=Rhizobium tropici TaxID=398 RepID=A0A329Y9Z5_RHITR|nr:LysR substrate-binding domain-containing protein [Rhizobium tropici]RAX40247.1 hypothetical protein DQ393_16580 [Rhizobium tropici]
MPTGHNFGSAQVGNYREVIEHVLEGRADIGLGRLPLDDKIFEWCPIATATNVYIFHRGHRLSQKDVIRPEDLIGEPLTYVEPQMQSHHMNENAMRYMGAEPNLAIQFDVTGQEVNFVAAGLGITSSNTFAARQFAAFPVEIRPLSLALSITTPSSGKKADGSVRFCKMP